MKGTRNSYWSAGPSSHVIDVTVGFSALHQGMHNWPRAADGKKLSCDFVVFFLVPQEKTGWNATKNFLTNGVYRIGYISLDTQIILAG